MWVPGYLWYSCGSPSVHVCQLGNNLGEKFMDPNLALIYLGFLWDTLEETVALAEDKTTQVETKAKKLLAIGSTT